MNNRWPPYTMTEHGENRWQQVIDGDIELEDFRRDQEDYYDQDNIRAEMRADT